MAVDSMRGFPKGVPAPALRALNAAGYHDLSDLADVPIADLESFHGLGPKALRVVQAALAERRVALRESEPDK